MKEGSALKKSKYPEEQIATAPRNVEAAAPLTEVTRKRGISEATYYIWRKQYSQKGIAEIRRLRQLEDENRKLKQLVANLTTDKIMLQALLAKNLYAPPVRVLSLRSCGAFRSGYDARAGYCSSIGPAGIILHYPRKDREIRGCICELAQARPRFGFQPIYVLLKREGWVVNRKRVHPIYREAGPTVRLRRRQKRAGALRIIPAAPI